MNLKLDSVALQVLFPIGSDKLRGTPRTISELIRASPVSSAPAFSEQPVPQDKFFINAICCIEVEGQLEQRELARAPNELGHYSVDLLRRDAEFVIPVNGNSKWFQEVLLTLILDEHLGRSCPASETPYSRIRPEAAVCADECVLHYPETGQVWRRGTRGLRGFPAL
jgi:hypothetical protein